MLSIFSVREEGGYHGKVVKRDEHDCWRGSLQKCTSRSSWTTWSFIYQWRLQGFRSRGYGKIFLKHEFQQVQLKKIVEYMHDQVCFKCFFKSVEGLNFSMVSSVQSSNEWQHWSRSYWSWPSRLEVCQVIFKTRSYFMFYFLPFLKIVSCIFL